MKNIIISFLVLTTIFWADMALAQPKGELVLCQGAEVTTLDVTKSHSTTDRSYADQIFDMLYFRDTKGIPQPRLAVSSKFVNDTTLEIKLRKGVKFHDGSEMTAKDVKFSIDLMKSPEAPLVNRHHEPIKETKIIDNYTIQIITKQPDPLLLKRLSFILWILPADLYAKGAESFWKHPVGTGPFKFVSWSRNDRMIFEANENYWDGAPKVKRLIFRSVPEIASRIAELQTGNADIVTAVPPFLMNQIKDAPNTTLQSIPTGHIMYLYINTLAKGPLENKKVRQALNYAVDKQMIIKNILQGCGNQIATLLTPYHFGYDPSLKPYPYDPGLAKKLLAEAGYDKGLRLTLNLAVGRHLMAKEICEAMASMFEAVGIKIDLNIVEYGAYLQSTTDKTMKDLGYLGYANIFGDADGTFSMLLVKGPFSFYSTPKLTDEIKKAGSIMDSKKRLALYKQMQRDIFDEAPFVFLYQPFNVEGISKKLKGYETRGDERFVLYKVSKEAAN
jgi:peptide/nickel transport system substrate-binding protein